MRKLVLGIIALVTVQFAFVTYTMLLKSSEGLLEDIALSQPVLTDPDVFKNDQVPDSTDFATEPEIVVPRLETRNPKTERTTPVVSERIERTAERRASSATQISKPAFAAAPADASSPNAFESVVIRYNRNPNVSDCPPSEVSKTKKRSYIAKAGPVIKKPWDWLKSIGSKLN